MVKNPRYLSLNGPSNGAFGGNGSFMSNGYVIWRHGLDGEPPNLYGVAQGETYAERMFYSKSTDMRSSYFQFVSYLRKIQAKEASKERDFVMRKLETLPQFPGLEEYKATVQKAIDVDNYGLAYTLMLRRNKNLEELKRELASAHFNNISHMNSFWADQFSSFFSKRILDLVEIRDHQLMEKIIGSQNITIGSVVDEWFDSILQGSDGAIVSSFDPLREQMKNELLTYFQKAEIEGVNNYNDSIFGTTGNITKLAKRKTTKKQRSSQDKKLSFFVRQVGDAIGNAVGKGIAGELSAIAGAGASGAIAVNTGTMRKMITNEFTGQGYFVQQKADGVYVELFKGSYNVDETTRAIYKDLMEKPAENLEELQKRLEEQQAKGGAEDIFMVEVSVKGYRSKRDLAIEGEGSFAQRASNLVAMSREADGLPALSMEKLIFMLNNTVEGCLQENRKEHIEDYLTAVCVAWMWDDYTELFSLNEAGSAGIKKIRLFNSGGNYYSASQILDRAISNLEQHNSDLNFAKIIINPPSFDADGMYRELKEQYPISTINASKEEWQRALAPRWDAMRDYVMANGTISINFKQAQLEKLLDDLYSILG